MAALARDTEGYSGSDLRNLCVAAAYRPIREVLERDGVWTDDLERLRRSVRDVRPQSGASLRLAS